MGARTAGLALLGTLASTCADAPPVAETAATIEPTTADSATPPISPSAGAEVFDREIVFLSTAPDSIVAIPWFFRASSRPDGITREEIVLLFRSGAWELLADNHVEHPVSRSPWRIVPGENTGLVVGLEDQIETLVFRVPPRELDVSLGNRMTEWARPGEAAVRLHESTALFPSGSIEGIVLDINRRWEARDDVRNDPGDWIFVRSDQAFQLYLEERVPPPDPLSAGEYGGWTRLAFRDRPWDAVEATWSELRPFEPARRDVPVRWTLATPDGSLAGELTAADAYLQTGSSDGPILPITGFIAVTGTIRIEGEEIEVSGLVRHVQH